MFTLPCFPKRNVSSEASGVDRANTRPPPNLSWATDYADCAPRMPSENAIQALGEEMPRLRSCDPPEVLRGLERGCEELLVVGSDR